MNEQINTMITMLEVGIDHLNHRESPEKVAKTLRIIASLTSKLAEDIENKLVDNSLK